MISVIPRILAGNKVRLAAAYSGGLRAGPTMRPGRAGCCARVLVASSAPLHGDAEVRPVMNGGGCVALAISGIRLVPAAALGHGYPAGHLVRSAGHA